LERDCFKSITLQVEAAAAYRAKAAQKLLLCRAMGDADDKAHGPDSLPTVSFTQTSSMFCRTSPESATESPALRL
jgi:hypothetical protein